MAHVQKVTTRGGKVRFQARYIDPAGKERAKNFDTMREAREYLVRVESAKLRREWLDPSLGRRTFAEWAQKVEASRINLRENPRLRDGWVVADLILPTFGELSVAGIDDELVQRWVMKLVEEGYAPSTVRKAYQTLARIMGAAVGKWIARSPCAGITLPPDDGRNMRILTEAEILVLAGAVPERYRALVLTAAFTGLRIGELAALRVRHVNFLRRTLRVEETLTEPRGHVKFGPPKTKAGRRTISVPETIVEVLAGHVGRFCDGAGQSADALVFTSERGTPLRVNHFRRRVWRKSVASSIGPPCRPHDLRHSHAAMLIKAGVHPKTIQVRLGHASIRTTMDLYGHLYEGVDEAAAEALESLYRQALETGGGEGPARAGTDS